MGRQAVSLETTLQGAKVPLGSAKSFVAEAIMALLRHKRHLVEQRTKCLLWLRSATIAAQILFLFLSVFTVWLKKNTDVILPR